MHSEARCLDGDFGTLFNEEVDVEDAHQKEYAEIYGRTVETAT